MKYNVHLIKMHHSSLFHLYDEKRGEGKEVQKEAYRFHFTKHAFAENLVRINYHIYLPSMFCVPFLFVSISL